MELTADEADMAAGRHGPAARWAIRLQADVGDALGARRFVPVTGAHLVADMEVLGRSGLEFLHGLTGSGTRVRVPTTTNARCVDVDAAPLLGQDPAMVADESRLKRLLAGVGVMLTDTCITYQTVCQPRLGEHVAWGDTGAVVYANSVFGARSNFEAGPAALAAGLTGRTPDYGFHRPERRAGTVRVVLAARPADLADWGAVGAVVGRRLHDYAEVPVFTGGPAEVGGDALKHLGAALASYGSLGMFHMVGVTPEAPDEAAASGGRSLARELVVDDAAVRQVHRDSGAGGGPADLVAFTGPQLSLFELRHVAELFAGRHVADDTTAVVTTNAQNHRLAADLGYLDTLRAAGVLVLSGTCLYLMDVPALRAAHGWRTLVTNSAKVANIVGGYGLSAVLRRTEACVDAAVTGRVPGV